MKKSLSPANLFLRLVTDAVVHHPAVRFLARTARAIQQPFIWIAAYLEYSQSLKKATQAYDLKQITDFDLACHEEDASAAYQDRLAPRLPPRRLFEPAH